MAHADFRTASDRERERLARTLVAAKVFGDADEVRESIAAEPWHLQVNDRGDVAVLGRWRDHLPVLSVEAMWCPAYLVPKAMQGFRRLAAEHGMADVVSPPVPLEDVGPYEIAGMSSYTTVMTLSKGTVPAEPPAATPSAVIRQADERDMDRLLALDESSFEPFWHYDARHMARFLQRGRLALAERDGEYVGYTLCTVDGDEGLIGRLCVAPSWRRKGIGTALLLDAVWYCGQQGARRATLSTQVDNATSQSLYRRAGFRDTGKRYAFLTFGTARG